MADSYKPVDPIRPDLDEGTNVAQTHGTVLEDNAAILRERRVRENGLEPVSFWLITSSAFVLIVAGALLHAGGTLFDYDEYKVAGYVQKNAPGLIDEGPVTMPISQALAKEGSKIYSKCAGCHQPDGLGDGSNFPPLSGSEWVTGDTQSLAMIILNGVKGEITVDGRTWNSNMPPQAPLSAKELASVMTFIRNSFGNATGDVVTVEMAGSALETYKERAAGAAIAPQMTEEELKSAHGTMLPGEAIDPATIVDLDTLQPVEAAVPAE